MIDMVYSEAHAGTGSSAPKQIPLIEGLRRSRGFHSPQETGSLLRALNRINSDYLNTLEYREGQVELMFDLLRAVQNKSRGDDGSERGYGISIPMHAGKTLLEIFTIAANAEFNNGRGIFMAPTEDLVKEHIGVVHRMLGTEGTVMLTGSVNPSIRHMHIGDARVFAGTPETVWNDFFTGYLHIGRNDIIVIDECHKNVGNYASAKLCDATNVKVFGFTATPGSSWAKVQGIMERAGFDMIRSNGSSMGNYMAGRSVETVMIEPAEYISRISRPLLSFIREKLQELADMGMKTPRGFINEIDAGNFYGIQERSNSGKRCMNEIYYEARKFDSRHAMIIYGELHRAVQSYEALTIGGASALLAKIREWRSKGESASLASFLADAMVMRALEDASKAAESGLEHPKMDFLYGYAKANPDAKVIVFANYRNTVHMIADRLNSKGISARAYTGKGKGMTKGEKSEVEEGLADGSVRWVVATSVASMGVNKFDVGHLICYDQAPSASEQEQRKGRVGRKVYGMVKELVYRGSWDEHRYVISKHQKINAAKVDRKLARLGSALPKLRIAEEGPVDSLLRIESHTMPRKRKQRKPVQLGLGIERTIVRPSIGIDGIAVIPPAPKGRAARDAAWQQDFDFMDDPYHRDDN